MPRVRHVAAKAYLDLLKDLLSLLAYYAYPYNPILCTVLLPPMANRDFQKLRDLLLKHTRGYIE